MGHLYFDVTGGANTLCYVHVECKVCNKVSLRYLPEWRTKNEEYNKKRKTADKPFHTNGNECGNLKDDDAEDALKGAKFWIDTEFPHETEDIAYSFDKSDWFQPAQVYIHQQETKSLFYAIQAKTTVAIGPEVHTNLEPRSCVCGQYVYFTKREESLGNNKPIIQGPGDIPACVRNSYDIPYCTDCDSLDACPNYARPTNDELGLVPREDCVDIVKDDPGYTMSAGMCETKCENGWCSDMGYIKPESCAGWCSDMGYIKPESRALDDNHCATCCEKNNNYFSKEFVDNNYLLNQARVLQARGYIPEDDLTKLETDLEENYTPTADVALLKAEAVDCKLVKEAEVKEAETFCKLEKTEDICPEIGKLEGESEELSEEKGGQEDGLKSGIGGGNSTLGVPTGNGTTAGTAAAAPAASSSKNPTALTLGGGSNATEACPLFSQTAYVGIGSAFALGGIGGFLAGKLSGAGPADGAAADYGNAQYGAEGFYQ